MRYIEGSVYSRVCAAGSHHADRGTEQDAEGVFQCLLHAGGIRLYLPSVEGFAVICQFDKIAGHVVLFSVCEDRN